MTPYLDVNCRESSSLMMKPKCIKKGTKKHQSPGKRFAKKTKKNENK